MAEKKIKTRIQQKHDIEANWDLATGFIPMSGEIIVYDVDSNYDYERFKIGDGKTGVIDLPFCSDIIGALEESFTVFGCTNQIPLSTDASGQVYNGIGYKNGIRWSSSGGGEVTADNMGMTGFIPVKPGDVLRLGNVSIVTNSYVIYFNANKQVITTDSNFSTDSDGFYTKTLDNSSAAFIRLAVGTISKYTIATINEEIKPSGDFGTGWLTKGTGPKFAPKTFISQIFDDSGESYSSVINNRFNTKADKAQGIFYIEGAGTTDTTNKVATWTGVHPDISEYYTGLVIAYKIGTAGSTSTTLNINNLGAVDVVRNATTAISTSFAVNSVILLVYTVDGATAYWKAHDYDANTRNTVGDYTKNGTKLYFVGTTTSDSATSSSYATSYTNSKNYIGTDNCLYSNGEKVQTGSEKDTTYDLSAPASKTNGNVTIDLTAGGSGSGTDSVKIKGSGATTVTTDANGVITISSTDTNTQDGNDNQTVKAGNVTFGVNDVVEFVAGSNVSISGDATNKKITISSTDNNTHNSHAVISGKKADGTTDIKGSASSGDITLGDSGVTAGEYGPTANATPGYGATFNVPDIKVNSKGIVTSVVNRTVKIPASDNSETTLTITDKASTDTANLVYAVTNLVEGGTKGHAITATYTGLPTKAYVDGLKHDHPYIPTSQKGIASGVAELDEFGKVPTAQLPSFVDDVLEYSAKSLFPAAGEAGKIYVDTATNKTYRWSGSTYVEISASLALGETNSTAFRGDLGKAAYDHIQIPHAPSDAEKNVQSDWAETDTSSDAFIKNKPSLATVATSGKYSDLTGKPTIPTVNNATLTIQKNGSNIATFTANSSTNATANITVPTKTSELTNDSGYLTSYTETDPTVPDWAKASSKPSYNLGEVSDTSGYVRMTPDERSKLSGIAAGAEVNVQSDWNATSGDAFIKNKPNVIVEGDTRLTDPRTPTSHSHGNISNGGALGTASRIVVTDTNKKITTGSIDPANLVVTTDSRLSDARTPTSHTHGSITNDGKLGTASRIVVTDTSKKVTVGSIDPANLVVTSDARLSDARTPKAHTHTKSDITDFPTSLPADGGNADTVDGKHADDFALASHGTHVTTETVKSALGTGSGKTKYLREDGTWVVPPDTTYSAASQSDAGLMSAADKKKLDGIATGANNYTLPAASSSTLGGIKVSLSGTTLTITTT